MVIAMTTDKDDDGDDNCNNDGDKDSDDDDNVNDDNEKDDDNDDDNG
jgi:hypothetical protein